MKVIKSALKTTSEVAASGFRRADLTVRDQRMDVCMTCENFDGKRCQICGCNMFIKAAFLATDCPEGFWPDPKTAITPTRQAHKAKD